jgi:hypothetical protein
MMNIPWPAYIYLCIFAIVAIAGHIDNYRSQYKWWQQITAVGSSIFVLLYVIGFFNGELGSFLKSFIIPMLLIGIPWEFYEIYKDLNSMANDKSLSSKESDLISTITLIITDLIVVPGYLAGIALAYRLFNE